MASRKKTTRKKAAKSPKKKAARRGMLERQTPETIEKQAAATFVKDGPGTRAEDWQRRDRLKPGPKPHSRRRTVHAIKLEAELVAVLRALVPLVRTTHGDVAGSLYVAWIREQIAADPSLADKLNEQERDALAALDRLYPD